jgi:hypothetical protein
MANSNFVVHNGLTVGPLTIDAASGNITTTGVIAVTGGGSFGGLDSAKIQQNASNVAVTANYVNVAVNGTNVASFSSTGLNVLGTTTTINSTTLTVADKNITVAQGAADSSAADGAGLTVDGASATLLYTHSTTSFNFNKAVGVNSGSAATALINLGTSGVGNIGASGATFNTVFAKATTAQYADVAENYAGDAAIEPGTVVHFGGEQEVSVCDADMCSAVAGVVSTNPAYLMNSEITAEHVIAVAFTGRVPCKVTGTVRKGDLMVSAGNGRARAEANPRVGTVIGKALADSEGDAVIEVVVGRF